MDIDEKEKNVLNLEKEDFEKMDDHQRIHCVGIILLSMAKRNEVLSNIITSFDPIEQKMIIRDYFTPLFENFNKLSTFFKKASYFGSAALPVMMMNRCRRCGLARSTAA